MLSLLNIFGRTAVTDADDTDTHLAAGQIGLAKKNRRWAAYLMNKREQILSRMNQSGEAAIAAPDADTMAWDAPSGAQGPYNAS